MSPRKPESPPDSKPKPKSPAPKNRPLALPDSSFEDVVDRLLNTPRKNKKGAEGEPEGKGG